MSQLITLMDGIKSNVMVVGATNKPNEIDQSLRRFGRFSKEIEVVSPDDHGRYEIMKIKTRNMQLADDVDLESIAHDAHGYTGGDLAQLVLEAGVICIRDQTDLLDLEDEELPMSQMRKIRVRQKDLLAAMANTNPSSLREKSVEVGCSTGSTPSPFCAALGFTCLMLKSTVEQENTERKGKRWVKRAGLEWSV